MKAVTIGQETYVHPSANLYGCSVGSESKVGAFVEIQKDAAVGNRCKIGSHTFICSGVTIEDEVFIGHGVMFINDLYPRATTSDGKLETEEDWKNRFVTTLIKKGAVIGTGAIIMGGVTIGKGATVGAGALVRKDVPDGETWVGNPARPIYSRDQIVADKSATAARLAEELQSLE